MPIRRKIRIEVLLLRRTMRRTIVALLFAACTTTMHFRVIDQGAYGEAAKTAVTVTPGENESTIRLDLGQRTTGGWSIEPLDVTSDGGVVVVKTKIHSPAAGSIVTQALTSPYAIITVNRRVTSARWINQDGTVVAESK